MNLSTERLLLSLKENSLTKLIVLSLAVGFLLCGRDGFSTAQAQTLSPGFRITSVGNAPPIPKCARENLKIREGETDAAMGGVRETPYIFTNSSPSACTLEGYPILELLNQRGMLVKRSTKQKTDEAITVVIIEPGKTAWFKLNYNSGGAGHVGRPCPTYNKARITIPLVARTFVLRTAIQTCPRSDFEVTRIQLGMPQ
jgi:Domain of unknown function (DUF4232)